MHYQARRVKTGFGLMFGAGTLSGLLGIGSGSLKVIAMDQAMQLPFKVSTATSNFMIGVTAAASASVYLSRGYVNPGIAMPVMLGVLSGSLIGARFLARLPVAFLRKVFAVVVGVIAIEMIVNGLRGEDMKLPKITDTGIERMVSVLLRTGVLLSGVDCARGRRVLS